MLSQSAEYALRTMVVLAGSPGEYLNAPALSRLTQVPLEYQSKILQRLANASLLLKKRGLKGGFCLKLAPGAITVLSIIEPFDAIERITSCPLKLKEHAQALCPLHKTLDETACALRERFGSVTLADLARSPRGPLCH